MHLQSMPFPNMISVGKLVHLFICTLIYGVATCGRVDDFVGLNPDPLIPLYDSLTSTSTF